MHKTTQQLAVITPMFGHLTVMQHSLLPLLTVSQLLALSAQHTALYLQLAGVCGHDEGLSLEIALGTPAHTINLATEGLYGLKNASKLAGGLTLTVELTPAMAELALNPANQTAVCRLVLKLRANQRQNARIEIKQISLIAE